MPVPERTIYAAYYQPKAHAIWLVAEFDEDKPTASCYVSSDQHAAWVTIELSQLKNRGTVQILP